MLGWRVCLSALRALLVLWLSVCICHRLLWPSARSKWSLCGVGCRDLGLTDVCRSVLWLSTHQHTIFELIHPQSLWSKQLEFYRTRPWRTYVAWGISTKAHLLDVNEVDGAVFRRRFGLCRLQHIARKRGSNSWTDLRWKYSCNSKPMQLDPSTSEKAQAALKYHISFNTCLLSYRFVSWHPVSSAALPFHISLVCFRLCELAAKNSLLNHKVQFACCDAALFATHYLHS